MAEHIKTNARDTAMTGNGIRTKLMQSVPPAIRSGFLSLGAFLTAVPIVIYLVYHGYGLRLISELLEKLWLLQDGAPFFIVSGYVVLLGLAIYWTSSRKFGRKKNHLFWFVTAFVYLVAAIAFICATDVSLVGDSFNFNKLYENSIQYNWSFKEWIRAVYERNGVYSRLFFAFLPFYKLFGSSVMTTTVINLTANFSIGIFLYWIVRFCFNNYLLGRVTALVFLFSPFGFFLSPAPLSCTVALAYLTGGFALMIYLIRKDEAKWRFRSWATTKWRIVWYELFLFLQGILFGILIYAAGDARNIVPFIKISMMLTGAAYLFGVFLKRGFRKGSVAHGANVVLIFAAAFLVATVFGWIGRACSTQKGLEFKDTHVAGLAWTRGTILDSFGCRDLAGRVENAMPQKEFMRQTLNDALYQINIRDISFGGKYNRRLIYRTGVLTNSYRNYKEYLGPGNDKEKFNLVYNEIFDPLRLLYIVLTCFAAVSGCFFLMRYHTLRNLSIILLLVNAFLLIFILTIGECSHRYSILMVPGSSLLAAFGIAFLSGPRSTPLPGRIPRPNVIPGILILLLCMLTVVPYCFQKLYSRTWHPMNVETAEFEPQNIGLPDSLRIKRENANAMFLPPDRSSGTMSWTAAGLRPDKNYQLVAFLRSSTPPAGGGYLCRLKANGAVIAEFDSGHPTLGNGFTREQNENKVSSKLFNNILKELTPGPDGRIDFRLEVEKSPGCDFPLWVAIFDCELW